MKAAIYLISLCTVHFSFSQINTVASGDWSNPAIWDCVCVPTVIDEVHIRHEVIVSNDQQAIYVFIGNENGLLSTDNASLTVRNGALFQVAGGITTESANALSGGQNVSFVIEDDNTRVEATGFNWIRKDSRAGTEMTFRMYNNSEFQLSGDFFFTNNDNTSSENNIDFMMGNNSGLSPSDESPYLLIDGDMWVTMDKTAFDSYLSVLMRERSTIEVNQNLILTIYNAPNDSDIYLYLADVPSRSTPGTQNLANTFSQLVVHGQFVMELPFISNTSSPDIRADIRGNASMQVGGFQMNYHNGNGIIGGNGSQDIDFYMFDQTSLTVSGDLRLESELQTPTTPSISNNLLFLQDDSYTLVEGNVIMRADVDHIENRLAMDGNATLEIKGNFDRNDGSPGSNYTTEGRLQLAGSSTVVMGGSNSQILPWAYLGNYQNLTINNSSGELMTLEGDVRINGHLDMQNGFLVSEFSPNSSNDDLFFVIDFQTTATANLGSQNSFITGRVRATDRNGSGLGLNLPLGTKNGSLQKWAPMTLNSFDIAINPSVYIQHVFADPPSGVLTSPLLGIGQFEYWEIGRNSSGAWASGELIDNASVTLYWNDACYYQINDVSTLFGTWLDNNNTISNLTDDKWTVDEGTLALGNECGAGDESGSMTFTLSNANRTRALVLGTSDPLLNPLPVVLSDFRVEVNPTGGALVKWITESELESDYFIISHSVDGYSFSEIGRRNAAGTTSEHHEYTLTHSHPNMGINYYHLNQMDVDGTSHSYDIVVFNYQPRLSVDLMVFPNPVPKNEKVQLVLNAIMDCQEINRVELISIDGKTSYLKMTDMTQLEIPTTDLQSGVYFIKVSNLCFDGTQKIVIE